MAITIQSNPGSYFSAHGDILFVAYEGTKANDPVTYPDYKYVCDVYIGAGLAARIKKVPQPDNKMGIFNVGDVIRNYVSSVFNPSPNVLKAQETGSGEFNIAATMKFGEEYGFTLYTNLTVDSARTYFNHYNGRLIGSNTNISSFANKVATARPTATPVEDDDSFTFLSYFAVAGTSYNYSIKSYNNGSLLNTISGSTTPAAANNMVIYNVSPVVLNIVSAGFLNGANYYTVQINSGTIYRFDLTCEDRYEVFTIHFLNRYGGFESRDFNKVSRKTLDIQKTDFGKIPYSIDPSGNVSYYNSNKVYNETRSVYASQYKEKMTLNTDILTDEEYQWMSDLILSPLAYIEMSGYFIPIAITANNYEFKKSINDKLTNLTIDIEFGEQFAAQYR